MREHGIVTAARGLGLHGHACWAYSDDAELVRAAAEYLDAGARLGQKLLYVGPAERLQLAPPDIEALPLSAFCELGRRPTPTTCWTSTQRPPTKPSLRGSPACESPPT